MKPNIDYKIPVIDGNQFYKEDEIVSILDSCGHKNCKIMLYGD